MTPLQKGLKTVISVKKIGKKWTICPIKEPKRVNFRTRLPFLRRSHKMNSLYRQAAAMGISPFRIYLADSLYQKSSKGTEELFWLLLHLSEQAGKGHLRTDIRAIEDEMSEWYGDENYTGLPANIQREAKSIIKEAMDCKLIGKLKNQDSSVDELPTPRPPIVLSADERYLYFLRRRREEDHLIAMLSKRSATPEISPHQETMRAEDKPEDKILYRLENGKRLLLLSGGPGTGKTHTVKKLLEKMEDKTREGAMQKVILCAPTGMAASRLAEAIPGHSGYTLHALLGIRSYGSPKHHAGNPIDADLVIVDEASMVDLAMMNALLDALAPQSALLLVGDPDQLPSVEAGALLGDMLSAYRESPSTQRGPLRGCVINLTKTHRSEKGVLQAAKAVRTGDVEAFMRAVNKESVCLYNLENPEKAAALFAEKYKSKGSADFTVLSPLRQGSWGIMAMNERISMEMGGTTAPFVGMPIVITRNDPSRSLWNGEKAVIEKDGSVLRALFSGSDAGRSLPLALLPGWETAWIQTVHKSQGLEYDSIAFLLPETAGRLLCREILYTALTRAKSSVEIYADEDTLHSAIAKAVTRNSRVREWAIGSR